MHDLARASLGVQGTLTKEMLEEKILAQRFPMRGLCMRMLSPYPNRSDLAEDLVQEAMMKALMSAGDYRQEALVSTWVYRITQNVVRDFLRKQKRQGAFGFTSVQVEIYEDDNCESVIDEDPLDAIGVNHSEEKLIANVDWRDVREFLLSISPVSMTTVYRKLAEGMSFSEIARLDEVPLSTVKTRYYRALREIRSNLHN